MDNKTLTDTVCRRAGVNRKEAANIIGALAQAIQEAASEMDIIAIPSFGNFEPKKRLERVMAVPSTGKRMLLPPKISISFRPASALKQKMRDTSNTTSEQ
ncbi:MAG: HU family DNA-binding protein [Prevotella sp.]|nr:HU family DNA-binding protein [Prevotella sp.]MCM1075292.1 HU family DNA-binding protein [Ruminococcus sp.]